MTPSHIVTVEVPSEALVKELEQKEPLGFVAKSKSVMVTQLSN
jgi:hypothetical protein